MICYFCTRRRGQVSDCFKMGYSDSFGLQVENFRNDYILILYIIVVYYVYIYTNTYIVYKYVSTHACIHIYIYISYVSLNIIAQWIVWLSCKKRQDLRTDGSSFKVKTVSVYPYCVIPLPFRE